MTSAKSWILSVLMLAASMAPVMAADWGGVKDMGGGVPIPVPAPAPVPTYDADSDWYVGLMLGGNLLNDASVKYSNPNIDVPGTDISKSVIYGLTFGRYITPSLRWEVAVDYTPDTSVKDGLSIYAAPGQPGSKFDGQEYGVFRGDTVKLSRTTALFNLLYDIPTGTRFTPYVGGGLGFTWRRLRRSTAEAATCEPTTSFPDMSCNGGTFGTAPTENNTSGTSTSKNQIDLAAAVQAGVATNLTESIIWDNGWQMMWEGGSISSSADSVAGINKFVIKDSVLQQFRSGLRIKFD
jgi:opacity protein-like surface antigen